MLNWLKNRLKTAATHAAAGIPDPAPPADAARLRAQGNAMLDAGRLDQAANLYRQACEADPRDTAALVNLGYVLMELGRTDAAQEPLTKAILLDPLLHDAHYMLGSLASLRADSAGAVDCYRRALAVKPDFGACARDLCVLLAQLGRLAEARELLQAGHAFAPGTVEFHFFSGNLHLAQLEFDDAVTDLRSAAGLAPRNAGVLTNLGLALHRQGDVHSAIDAYQRALAIQPDDAPTHCNLGGAFQIRGQLDLAVQSYRHALRLQPDYVDARHNLLYALSFDPATSAQDYLREARQFGDWASARAKPLPSQTDTPREAVDRPLRVGLVSGDFTNHAVGAFLEGIVAQVDPRKLALVAYSTQPREDLLTGRIKPCFAQWNMVAALSDQALAEKIRADRIDILVDLAGHTAHNRLPVFAWRPAPVQVAWLGYWASTGVSQMDYILVDPVSVPESARHLLSERAWYLPDTRLCFTPPVTAQPIDVSPLPALHRGYVTFGSFQILSKLSDATLAAWSRVLKAHPGSRLRLQNRQLGYPAAQQETRQRLAALGIDSDRVDLHGGSLREAYLRAYGEVDMVLDTFPFPGGTTTVEALWMGVPTMTLSGHTLLERQGESLLRCAGLDDWVAASVEDYVARAIAHAADVDKLAQLRADLRARVLASPLFDASRFARHLEQAFADMWQAHERGQAGASQ